MAAIGLVVLVGHCQMTGVDVGTMMLILPPLDVMSVRTETENGIRRSNCYPALGNATAHDACARNRNVRLGRIVPRYPDIAFIQSTRVDPTLRLLGWPGRNVA